MTDNLVYYVMISVCYNKSVNLFDENIKKWTILKTKLKMNEKIRKKRNETIGVICNII